MLVIAVVCEREGRGCERVCVTNLGLAIAPTKTITRTNAVLIARPGSGMARSGLVKNAAEVAAADLADFFGSKALF